MKVSNLVRKPQINISLNYIASNLSRADMRCMSWDGPLIRRLLWFKSVRRFETKGYEYPLVYIHIKTNTPVYSQRNRRFVCSLCTNVNCASYKV